MFYRFKKKQKEKIKERRKEFKQKQKLKAKNPTDITEQEIKVIDDDRFKNLDKSRFIAKQSFKEKKKSIKIEKS